MQKLKKFLSMLLAFVMVLGVAAPVFAEEDTNVTNEKIIVNVHKILMSKEDLGKHKETKEYDPATGIQNITEFFGNSAQAIEGVYFVAIDEYDSLYNKEDASLKASDITDWDAKEEAGTAGKTDSSGVLKLTLENNKKYKIFEVKEKSTYQGTDKEILAEQKAVPVLLELPKHATNQDGLQKEIHVYPKNTEDGPKVDKFVKPKDGVQNDETKEQFFDKDEEHTWVIRADIPTGMKDYQVFELNDTLEEALTYVQGQTVNVEVVDKVTDTADSGITLKMGTDYTLTEPTGDGGKLDVVFTAAGIAKLAQVEGKQVKVEFNTTINDKAIMSKNIENKVELNYGHDPDNKKTKKPDKNPRVYTGGKKFKKVDGATPLQGAEFVIKKGDNQYLVEKDGKYSWKTIDNATTKTLAEDQELKKLVSDKEGKFEITGLKYERPDGTKYKLVEVKAPEKYALPTNNEVEFTVDDKSYYKDATATDLVDADPQEIDNKPITIPQTGGIGTIIFTVGGIALMGGAAVAMKKNKEEDEE